MLWGNPKIHRMMTGISSQKDLTMVHRHDIVKVSDGERTTIAKVLDSDDEGVLVFRDTGNVWLSYKEYEFKILVDNHSGV